MEEYRICENKYGYFKLQRWIRPKKILFINLKGKWEDNCLHLDNKKPILFNTLSGAKGVKKEMIEARKKENNEWRPCI